VPRRAGEWLLGASLAWCAVVLLLPTLVWWASAPQARPGVEEVAYAALVAGLRLYPVLLLVAGVLHWRRGSGRKGGGASGSERAAAAVALVAVFWGVGAGPLVLYLGGASVYLRLRRRRLGGGWLGLWAQASGVVLGYYGMRNAIEALRYAQASSAPFWDALGIALSGVPLVGGLVTAVAFGAGGVVVLLHIAYHRGRSWLR
jgi:hypothetical protein